MTTTRTSRRSLVSILAIALAPVPALFAQDASTALPEAAPFVERVVAGGGADDFATVRHVRLEGTQREIGERLATLARDRHGWRPSPSRDTLRTRAQRVYFERNAPFFLERMRGVAGVVDAALEDDALDLASLDFGFARPGCTVTHIPPGFMASGKSVVSRNFDFTTGTFRGERPGPGDVAICASPYVLETRPTEGYAALTLCAYDLLGGVVDGINEEGLVIALLADDEVMGKYRLDGAKGPQAGFGVVQIGRHVLETCATVEEAKEAFLQAKLYYGSIPCHYLVADRDGAAFVWENSVFMTQGYIIEDPGKPLVTTNFLHHLNPNREAWPKESHPSGSFRRAEAVFERVEEARGNATLDFVKETSRCVAATVPDRGGSRAPGRTLWHALYVPEDRTLEVDFYLGEGEDGEPRRSGYRRFQL